MSENTTTYEGRPDQFPVASVSVTDDGERSFAQVRIASRSIVYENGTPEPSEGAEGVSASVIDSDITTLYLPVVDASVLLSMSPVEIAREIVMNTENYDFHAPLSAFIIDSIPRSEIGDQYDIEELVNAAIEDHLPEDTFRVFGDVQTEVFDTDEVIDDPMSESYSIQSLIGGTLRSLGQSSLPAVRRPAEV